MLCQRAQLRMHRARFLCVIKNQNTHQTALLSRTFFLCGQLVIYGPNLDGKHPSINSRREFQRQDAEPKLIQQHQD